MWFICRFYVVIHVEFWRLSFLSFVALFFLFFFGSCGLVGVAMGIQNIQLSRKKTFMNIESGNGESQNKVNVLFNNL